MLDTSVACREKNHENELLKSFCKQCKVCICDKCGQTRHNNHTKVHIDQAAKQHKIDIEEIVEEMKNGIADYKEHVEKTKEFSRKSREKIATARSKVMTSLEELIRLLKKHESTTLTSLEVIEEKEQRGLVAQLQHFRCSEEQLQTSVEYCEAILQRNQSVEILQAHHTLIERCRGLLNSEKLNIYKPPHVSYKLNKEVFENVRSAVPAVGRVVVSSTDSLQSVAEGSGLQEPDVGSEATIKITTKDSHENKCYEEEDQIHVKVQTPSGEELSHLLAPSEGGEHLVTFTPDCVGQHDVLIAVNGQPLTGSPWRVHVAPHRYKSVFSFGTHGKGQGQFDQPLDIAINDKTMNIAVADLSNNRVQLFYPDGSYLKDIGAGKLTRPTSVAFTRSSEVIVVASAKIFCFNDSGDFLKRVTNKHLKEPRRLTIGRDGRMVVCDGGDNTVKVLSSDGAQLLHTISAPDRALPLYAVCHQNMFFVCYPLAQGVKVFNEDGVFLYSIGTPGSGDGQLSGPFGFTIDMFDNLVVCDSCNKRLQVFTLDGKFVSKIEGQHIRFAFPYSAAVSSTGQLFVAEREKHCVHVLK